MSVFDLDFLEEFDFFQEQVDPNAQNKILAKTRLSKIQSLNQQIQNLIQKKIRIDLEIKRTKNKLSKLKSQSKSEIKIGFQLESADSPLFLEDTRILYETDSELLELALLLRKEIAFAEELITEAENLPLFED